MSPQMRHGRPVPASHRKPNQGNAAASSKAPSSGQATPAGSPAPKATTPATGSPAKSGPTKASAPAKSAAPVKGAAPARGVTPKPKVTIDPDADLRDDSLALEEAPAVEAASTGRTRTRTRSAAAAAAGGEGRRRRRSSEPSRNPILRGLRGYFGAYLPLLAAFCVLFVAVFVYATVTHTPTPAENWTSITDKWKPQADAARAKVFAEADKKDVAAEIAAFRELSTALNGWANALDKAPKPWKANSGTDADNQQAVSSMGDYITNMRAYAVAIDSVTKAGDCAAASPSGSASAGTSAAATATATASPSEAASASSSASPTAAPTACISGSADTLKRYSDALAEHSDELTQDDYTWTSEYRTLTYLLLGTDPLGNGHSPVPTLMLPTQPPTAAPSAPASASAAPSAAPSAS